ncbi:uncharacterized protein BKCO1_1200082 [Diplodia corticola]|uniref:Uncharacterized protein n=1 Tax=Diplodia corticola TaxID=236234 RepID=A0A1J9R7T1_9PEZI|nr:uncharacterized protein BKCO1_1200082 [Diplodia corticola]OJD36258.1 hypothetical protein BKCO1_1200082 [Diplodia corticola]
MPLCTLHLLALTRPSPVSASASNPTDSADSADSDSDPVPPFLTTLLRAINNNNEKEKIKPLTIARPLRWIVTPSAPPSRHLPAAHQWDLLLILPATATSSSSSAAQLPSPLLDPRLVAARWSVTFGVPGRVLRGYEGRNEGLLRGPAANAGAGGGDDVPAVEEAAAAAATAAAAAVGGGGGAGAGGAGGVGRLASSAQGLELSGELMDWVREVGRGGGGGGGAVSMLNLLAFRDGMKGEYLKYGKAFAEDVGRRWGGVAKIVGTVVEDGGGRGVGVGNDGGGGGGEEGEKRVWDEVALAHYPSIWHFAGMLASEDYQAVNQRHRVGSLKDTFILCTTELGLPGGDCDGKEGRAAAKL